MNPNDYVPRSHTEPAARTLPTGGIGSPGRTRGTIVFVRNKETGLIEQAVVKLAQATITQEQAEEIRDRVDGTLRNQPVVIVGMEWNVEVVG